MRRTQSEHRLCEFIMHSHFHESSLPFLLLLKYVCVFIQLNFPQIHRKKTFIIISILYITFDGTHTHWSYFQSYEILLVAKISENPFWISSRIEMECSQSTTIPLIRFDFFHFMIWKFLFIQFFVCLVMNRFFCLNANNLFTKLTRFETTLVSHWLKLAGCYFCKSNHDTIKCTSTRCFYEIPMFVFKAIALFHKSKK